MKGASSAFLGCPVVPVAAEQCWVPSAEGTRQEQIGNWQALLQGGVLTLAVTTR